MGYTEKDWRAINTIRTLAVSQHRRAPHTFLLSKLPLRHNYRYYQSLLPQWIQLLTASFIQVDATFKANSGHPGAPMGLAPAAHVLFNKFMTFNPKNPDWVNRDRFVLSYVFGFVIYAPRDGVFNLCEPRHHQNSALISEIMLIRP
ncbi:MAG TPA: hypothetical protein VFQ43_16720 [Nitrososphaera sp.]|nr:hypothetical protein [Nitrososphaera sp.]